MKSRIAFLTVSFLAFTAIAGSGAVAQKEQFERTKPHVNVGTVGNAPDPNALIANETGGRPDGTLCPTGEVWLSDQEKCGPPGKKSQ